MNTVWLLPPAYLKTLTLLVPAGALLLAVLLVTAVFIFVVRSPKAGIALVLALLGVLLSLGLVAAFFIVVPVSWSNRAVPSTSAAEAPLVEPAPAAPAAPTPEPPPAPIQDLAPAVVLHSGEPMRDSLGSDPWDPSAEAVLSASVHSSAASAALALARAGLAEMSPRIAETPVTVRIVVAPALSQQSPTLGARLGSVFRDAFPLAAVAQATGEPETAGPESLVIRVDQPESQSSGQPDGWLPQVTGTVRLSGTYRDQIFEDVKRYADKPWVDRFDEFVSNHSQRALLRANCRTFASDEASAYQDAVRVAVDNLVPRVRTVLQADTHPGVLSQVPDGQIRQQLQAALERNELVADRFSQQLDGAFGHVWRAALLIDADPSQLTTIVQQAQTAAQHQQRHSIATGMAVLLMLALVLVLYYVLNELTKGYFVWNLRAATMVALLTIVVALCWWIA